MNRNLDFRILKPTSASIVQVLVGLAGRSRCSYMLGFAVELSFVGQGSQVGRGSASGSTFKVRRCWAVMTIGFTSVWSSLRVDKM